MMGQSVTRPLFPSDEAFAWFAHAYNAVHTETLATIQAIYSTADDDEKLRIEAVASLSYAEAQSLLEEACNAGDCAE